MTTFTNFVPSSQAPFQFQPTLDGQVYSVIVTWNLFGQRYYVNCYDLSGNLIFSLPLIGSPVGVALDALTWELGTVTATTLVPHGYAIGDTVALTLSGCTPDAFNGQFEVLITGPSNFTYPMVTYPGLATAFGQASYNINLAGGYFTTSTLVYRAPNMQFEVAP